MDLIQFLDDFDELHDYDQIPRRVVIDRIDPLHVYDDIKFYQRYRMRKESAIDLIRLLEADLQRPTKRSSAIPTSLQVLATVRFMGTGKFQREDADLHGISQPSMSRIVHDVLESMARLREEFIKFPTEEEYYVISNRFREHRGFPGVIGAVDCTHIRIKNPGGNDAELFRNRKGWMSINTQVVCDDKLIIRDIVASHRGSAHDARIFNESTLRHRLEQLPHEFHILGEECINMPHMTQILLPSQGIVGFVYKNVEIIRNCVLDISPTSDRINDSVHNEFDQLKMAQQPILPINTSRPEVSSYGPDLSKKYMMIIVLNTGKHLNTREPEQHPDPYQEMNKIHNRKRDH
uniref:Putative nuclease HARBI1 n=1 Tax=Romanomermis culicivorax TaxID=13658 RepID=A0A915HHX2_ROMCU